MAVSDPAIDVPTPTGTLQGVAAFSWDGSVWQPSGRAGPAVATPTGVLQGGAPFSWSGSAWTPAGRAQPGVATPTGVLDGIAVYTWSGAAWTPTGGTATAATPSGALRGVAAFNWDGSAWQPAGQAGPSVATPYGVLAGVALFNWTGSAWAAVQGPSLDLSFMSGPLDPRVTFTRASAATYFDATGTMQISATNAPRFDYNPITHVSNGLLIEEQRANLVTTSGNIAGWGAGSNVTVTASSGVVPDGTNSATRVIENVVASVQHAIATPATTIVANAAYTFSLYAKPAGRTLLELWLYNSAFTNNIEVTFNLSAGTAGPITYGGTASGGLATITPVGNGWYRCSVGGTLDASSTTAYGFGYLNNGSTNIYTGDGVSGVLVWGGQLEQGAFPTSYIPTTAAAVTRSADLASMPTAAWFTAASGTYEGEFIPNGLAAGLPIVISGNAGSPTIATGADSRMTAGIRSGAAVFSATGPLYTFGSVNKAAFAYITGASTAAVNGTSFGPNATALTVTGTVVEFGSDGVTPGNNALNGWLRRVRYWPRVLSTAELQAATT